MFQERFCTHTLFHFLHSLHFQERLSWRWDCLFQDSLVFPVVDETQVKVLWWESEALIRSNGIKYRRKKILRSGLIQSTETGIEVLLLSAVRVMVFPQELGSFSSDNGDDSENVTVQRSSPVLMLCCNYSNSLKIRRRRRRVF